MFLKLSPLECDAIQSGNCLHAVCTSKAFVCMYQTMWNHIPHSCNSWYHHKIFNFTELLFIKTSDAFTYMKIQVLWHVMLYHLVRGYIYFGGTTTLQNIKNCSVTSQIILTFFNHTFSHYTAHSRNKATWEVLCLCISLRVSHFICLNWTLPLGSAEGRIHRRGLQMNVMWLGILLLRSHQ